MLSPLSTGGDQGLLSRLRGKRESPDSSLLPIPRPPVPSPPLPPRGGAGESDAPPYLPIARVILWMAFQRLRSAPRAPSSSRRAL